MIQSFPYHPSKEYCCEACVFGQGEHTCGKPDLLNLSLFRHGFDCPCKECDDLRKEEAELLEMNGGFLAGGDRKGARKESPQSNLHLLLKLSQLRQEPDDHDVY